MFRRSRSAPHIHPSLQLGFLPQPGEDVRALLFPKVGLEIVRRLLLNCPGIAATTSKIAGLFCPADTPRSERWRWPGAKLISNRHQITLEQKTPGEIERQFSEIELLAKQAKISPLLASVLHTRGLRGSQEVINFLNPSIDQELSKLPDYCRLSDNDPSNVAPMGRAVLKILEMVRCKKEIVIVADYDADGNCAAAILTRAIWMIGGKCSVLQPDRQRDGYGLSDSMLSRVQALKPDLVLTLDLGTTNKSQIDALRKSGCTTIVVDHHELLKGKTAQPDVMVNPKSSQEWIGYQELCATGLTWLLSRSLILRHGWVPNPEGVINELLHIAAIGTIGDVMPLGNLNRAIVKEGITAFKDSSIPALQVLSEFRKDSEITGEYLGFQVVPLLNAAGRIKPGSDVESGTAITLEFLLTNSVDRAQQLFKEMEAWNKRRKDLEEQGLIQARAEIAESINKKAIVHCGRVIKLENVHEGVVGLVAARMSENMQCPIVVLTKDKAGNWKGSGRSIPGASLMQILGCDELKSSIEQYGGHDAAAGVRISANKVDSFSFIFGKLCQEAFGVIVPEDNPFADFTPRLISPPKVGTWVKEYRPDLIMTIEQLAARSNDVAQCCVALEPCGRENAPLRILLPRVQVVSCIETAGEHLRVVLKDGPNPKGDWRSEEKIEAIIFKRGLAKPVIAELKTGELLDLIVQPTFDRARAMQGGPGVVSANVVIAEPTVFTYAGEISKKVRKVEKKKPQEKLSEQASLRKDLFDRFSLPKFTSIQHFCEYFNIKGLTNKVQFREKQIAFIAHQLARDRAYELSRNKLPLHENLLIKVNTGGGKTVIAFIKAAQVLSQNPNAKVLYLAPQHDLCEQTLLSAREMLDLKAEEIVEVTGEQSQEKRRASYSGVGRLFIGTPQTLQNDADLSMFNLVVLDEIHLMRGDEHSKAITRYAYRWVVDQVLQLQEKGCDIRLWAQSGSPASNREELSALIKTLHARWAKAWLPTGKNDWKTIDISLPNDYSENLANLSRCYQDCFLELKEAVPVWVRNATSEREISAAHATLGAAVRSFYQAHESKGNRTFPSRIQLLENRARLLKATDIIEKELKTQKVGSADSAWVWKIRTRLHELQLLSSLFEELKSKGRAAFMRAVTHLMIETIYPLKKDEPESFNNYKVRTFRREHFKKTLDWALVEPIAKVVAKEFNRIYPGMYAGARFRESFAKSGVLRKEFRKLLDCEEHLPEIDTIKNSSKKAPSFQDILDLKLRPEMLACILIDPKEQEIVEWVRGLPADTKIMIMCDEKFEAELLSMRLNNAGLKAEWYAGKSVKKSVGLKDNLEKFRKGEVQVLCSTSAGDTGHDIDQVSYILRLTPLTSPKKNAQTRGRVGRQEGLKGEYLFVAVKDKNPDIDEMQKFYRAKTRLWAMERIG